MGLGKPTIMDSWVTEQRLINTSPVQIGTDKDWKTISAGWDHAVAIKYNGTLWGWGRNNYGQLADTSKVTHLSPYHD